MNEIKYLGSDWGGTWINLDLFLSTNEKENIIITAGLAHDITFEEKLCKEAAKKDIQVKIIGIDPSPWTKTNEPKLIAKCPPGSFIPHQIGKVALGPKTDKKANLVFHGPDVAPSMFCKNNQGHAKGQNFSVSVVSLEDAFFAHFDKEDVDNKLKYIKIDIEGTEFPLLEYYCRLKENPKENDINFILFDHCPQVVIGFHCWLSYVAESTGYNNTISCLPLIERFCKLYNYRIAYPDYYYPFNNGKMQKEKLKEVLFVKKNK